ncbi:MAG: pyrrolo-quinoline quinone [Bryobacteraceae bacterium]
MRVRSGFLQLSVFAASLLPLAAQPNVLTYHNDVFRTGQNLAETILTTSNVNSATFGKLFQATLDGLVDAQPLYVGGISIPGQGTHNLLIAATENDSLYALDADSGAQIWKVSLLPSGETPSDNRGCDQVTPQIGITSTPVIGLKSGTSEGEIFAVAMSKDSSGKYHQRLHRVSLTTGKALTTAVEIVAKYPGTGEDSKGGYAYFNPAQYKERSGLLLLQGVVYLTWGSHCDFPPYTGWVIGYDATTLVQTSVIDVTPNGSEGAIWGAGAGLAADSNGYIYFLDANGTFDTTLNGQGFPANGDFGNAFIKLSTAGNQLTVKDYFTMYNTTSESDGDVDLGSGGALVLPDMTDANGEVQHLAIGAGKDSNIYLVNRDNMGKFNAQNDSAIYQELDGALPGGIWSMPAYFNGNVYFGSVGGPIRAFQFSKAVLSSTPVATTGTQFPYPGATPSISANGTTNAILWAVANNSTAVLHAYAAANLAQELYNTNQAAKGRDHFGAGNKFMVPTIAHGKVYVGTPNGVAAFGLLGQ